MQFWDTSAVIPLVIDEPASPALRQLLRGDQQIVVWWATQVECISALARRWREGIIGVDGQEQARRVLDSLAGSWTEVLPTARLRSLAERLLAVHPLRSADALHLAAALRWCEAEPAGRGFVCLDQRLREAARREGFGLLPEHV